MKSAISVVATECKPRFEAYSLEVIHAFRGPQHLFNVLRSEPVDRSLVIGVSTGRDEPLPGLLLRGKERDNLLKAL
jgi:hypothetical protein